MYSAFGCKEKSSSKHINMGSSFEDLDASSSKVKTVCHLNGWFSGYFVFKLRFKKLKMYNQSATDYTNYTELDVQKKRLSKPINMGSSFENLDERSSKVKMVRYLD